MEITLIQVEHELIIPTGRRQARGVEPGSNVKQLLLMVRQELSITL